uniref:N-acetylglucosamine-6-phosphate deacetylase n=1 Tax=Strigamia maritima TaxID=126957 RepID=T1IK78_STRMM
MTPTKGTLIQFVNCKLVRKQAIISEDLWVRNGKIIDPFSVYFEENTIADVVVDCKGYLVAPSFIDVQINGAFGIDFSNEDDDIEKGLEKVCQGLLAHGVTSFCPTVITSPSSHYHKNLPKMSKVNGSAHRAGILGVHVEGPFISRDKPGAHPLNLIQTFENGFKDVENMYGDLSNVCLVTLAPELPFALDIIKELSLRGITVSLGHSIANLAEGEIAVKSGATFVTHLFNAMLPFHHRDPGLVGLLASDNIPIKKQYSTE